MGPGLVLILIGCGLVELARRLGLAGSRAAQAQAWALPLAAATTTGGLAALAWVAFKVGALSYGGGFVINPPGELLRTIPVASYMREAMTAPFVYFRLGDVTELPTLDERARFYERYAREARTPRRGQPITDDQLQAVADLYRAAERRGDPPVRTIVEQLEVTRGTAQRWVNKARERHLLEPSPRSEG